eukprot:13400671-Alexandrium_andersonii.AAC.1
MEDDGTLSDPDPDIYVNPRVPVGAAKTGSIQQRFMPRLLMPLITLLGTVGLDGSDPGKAPPLDAVELFSGC